MTKATRELKEGYELPSRSRIITQEIMTKYSEGLNSALSGKRAGSGINIHTDVEFAKAQGLATTMADGMIFTATMSAMMTDFFGEVYLKGGRLQTKFIKPIWPQDHVTFRAVIKSKVPDNSVIKYYLDLWCENQRGETVVVGTVSAVVH